MVKPALYGFCHVKLLAESMASRSVDFNGADGCGQPYLHGAGAAVVPGEIWDGRYFFRDG